MSNAILGELASVTRRTSVSICWSQWAVLGAGVDPASSHPARAIVDPEALVLLSLWNQRHERRLTDLVGWWADAGSRWTSVKRLRTICRRFPGSRAQHFGTFARMASDAGDRRWAPHAINADSPSHRPAKGPQRLSLSRSSSLMIRMRAGFGVGAKADVLTYLLGAGGARSTVATLSRATGYTGTALRSACTDLALARFIRETKSRPKHYFLTANPWVETFDLEPHHSDSTTTFRPPAWRFWPALFAFLAAVDGWVVDVGEDTSPHVAASRARDLVERHGDAFSLNQIPVPTPADYPGPAFLQGFLDTVDVVAGWVQDHL